MAKFSTHILDEELARRRGEGEALRHAVLAQALSALQELPQRIPFEEACLSGSVVKPHRVHPDVAFLGLSDEHFFEAMAFLSARRGRDADVVQLERVPFAERIKREGIRWTKPS
ncbi:MAG: hypothetical protein ACP5LJ_00545 [Candidatus Bipolaricaulaceae bacterium]